MANGVPVIGIANPTSKGLSHNRFEQFNVDKPGVVFNNSLSAGTSKLAGNLEANPNLAQAAKAILTEVTGNKPSTLAGTMEVFGAKADVIVANPNGVTLNGVSTVNMRGFVATTGVPDLADARHLNVQNNAAQVIVGNLGVDTRDLSYFDIVSRVVTLNGSVGTPDSRADVQVVAGLNRYDSQLRTASRLQGTAENTPGIAIDGSLAGAMHGGHITLISTESGVGVRHAGLIHSERDIRIMADGDIALTRVDAGRDLTVQTSGDLALSKMSSIAGMTAAGDIHITADDVHLSAATNSSRFTANAKTLNVHGTTLKTTANDPHTAALSIKVDELNLTGTLVGYDYNGRIAQFVKPLDGALVVLENGIPNGTPSKIVSSATIESAGGMDITARRLNNTRGIIDNHGSQGLRIAADTLNNTGIVRSNAAIDVATQTFNNHCTRGAMQTFCGGIFGGTTAVLKTDALYNEGALSAAGDLTLHLGHGRHTNAYWAEFYSGNNLLITRRAPGITADLLNYGQIAAKNNLIINQDNVTVGKSGSLAAHGDVRVRANSSFSNSSNWVVAGNDLTITTQVMRLWEGSNLLSGGSLSLSADTSFASEQGSGIVARQGDMTLTAGHLYNGGNMYSAGGNLVVRAGGNLTNTGTVLASNDTHISSDGILRNTDSGIIASDGALSLTAKGNIFNTNGSIIAGEDVTFTTPGSILNDGGSWIDGMLLTFNGGVLHNRAHSVIYAHERLELGDGITLLNTDGAMISINGEIHSEAEPGKTLL
ncbi:hypothetical protein GCM10017655_09870 [Pseudomonas turukhanskensis]|uniref:Filamentous haemagglutinin FhaB/tRNA nuclease CdiA-like TPS domain-containing protein n=2 Tax=Pseudomonas turukhanskensis TaxID=1806536 RepID=A0A9W6NEP6_9PSED|nr:hypothetical protein GCM10017655_09870 [Pseudomonas turukhanskensis]